MIHRSKWPIGIQRALFLALLVYLPLTSRPTPSLAEVQPAAPDTSLAGLEAALRAHPDAVIARQYRQVARRAGQLDSAIAELKSALAQAPAAQGVRFELALALVDRLNAEPALDLPAQSVAASQSIRLLTEILTADPEQWAARYARGMAHLLFPRTTKHLEPAAQDFLRLLEVQRARPPVPHYARAFVGLGDAYVLNLELKAARAAWETGKRHFPADPELAERLGYDLRALESQIAPRYGFDRPFDTDRDYLWIP